jgi:DNA polymerase III subunit epsilon
MRQIVLDTETTGLNPRTGDRIIEVGCVELMNRRLTGNNFHMYINPERDSEEGALAVHGLTTEFLRDKPKFAEIAEELRVYISDAEIIIHNAPFDVGFLDMEFDRVKMPRFTAQVGKITDTLVHAKEIHPGKRNSLDALCTRYGISNAHRALHGALLDAELLAEVYLAMTRGQDSFSIDLAMDDRMTADGVPIPLEPLAEILVLAATPEELVSHEAMLDALDKTVGKDKLPSCVWRMAIAKVAEGGV